MWPLLFVALLAVPLAELWVVLEFADRIGLAPTLALLLVISIVGASLLKQQGLAAWSRVQAAASRGEIPSRELVDGALVVVGGALLLTPGFLTDVLGIVLLVPPTRAAAKEVTGWLFRRSLARRYGYVVERRVYSDDVRDAPHTRDAASPALGPRSGADGSPRRE
jgi:UPF0716 protein FxsA